MRKISVAHDGKKMEISLRPLRRGEIKKLVKYGYNYIGCIPTMETAMDAIDKSFDLVLTKKEIAFLDDCDCQDAKEVWTELLRETYGDPKEEKNSGNTSAGTLTENE